jgi:D-lactate dehydrogenase
MMSIVFFETEDYETEILLEMYGDVDYSTVNCALNPENVHRYKDTQVISSFIYSDLGRNTLSKMKNLKLIATRSRGFDHIDLDYCNKNGIVVTNVPDYGIHTVAEHVFALLLGLARHIPEATRRTREGGFSFRGLQGFDLRGQKLGVIGTGAIGLEVIRIANGFGMNVLACDIKPQEVFAKEIGFTYTSFDKILAQSDIISLHAPRNTKKPVIIGQAEFDLMKQGVVIVNTAYGDAIDPKALLKALHDRKVRAAGLDVLPQEPAIREEAELLRPSFNEKHDPETVLANRALLLNKNVIVTPHSAFYTKDTVRDILCTTGNNINDFLNGSTIEMVNAPKFIKNPHRL